MMRVVLDTNILVRVVTSPNGPAAELFDRLYPTHLLVTSAPLLLELSRTLAYDRLRKLHGLGDAELKRFVDRVETGSLVVDLMEPSPRVVPDDADDDFVIATSVAGGADVICTRNRHLRHPDVILYCAARSIRVADDLELLQEMRTHLDEHEHE
jgi:putative PIN family toxin of toxin-antitoxin system